MEEVVATEPSVDPSPLTDLFEVGVLEALLAHESVCLTSKRALVCVNKLCEAMTLEHLHLKELHVDASDCTVTNARWILNDLMAPNRVPDLRVCAKGELFAPKMKLKEIAAKKHVRISDNTSCIGATASFFLGHALAHSDGYVRLTNGRQKRLCALRENPRVQLLADETYEEIDVNLMAGALLVNAERRVDHLRLGEGYVCLAMLEIDDRGARELGEHMRRVLKKDGHWPSTLNLAHNKFGALGLGRLLLPSYGLNGVVPKSNSLGSHVMKELVLSGVSLGCSGVKLLAEVFAHDRLVVRELALANVHLGREGIQALVAVYARRSETEWGHGEGGLQKLNLSNNPLTDSALAPLRKADAFPCLRVLRLQGLERLHATFWPRLAIAIAKDKRFPLIESVYCDSAAEGTNDAVRAYPLRRAVALMRSRRQCLAEEKKWNDWECQHLANYLSDDLAREREHAAFRRKRRALEEIKDQSAPHCGLTDNDELEEDEPDGHGA